jgi:transcriptional regulator with XRE-family HTH domain
MQTVDNRELLREAPLKMIGARINRQRKHQDLSLDRLAEAAGTSRQHLINLEKGRHRPRLEMLVRLAEALGKPVDYFLVEEAGEPRPFPVEAI